MIVFQCYEIVFSDLRVGRVRVFDVDRTVRERGVTKRVIDSDDALRIQLVMLRQRSPAILSIQKFVGQPKLQFRMISKIADCTKTELVGTALRHHERVGIVEAERLGRADPGLGQLSCYLFERQWSGPLQNLLRDGAGVFRIKVDLSAAKRFPKNDGATHPLPMLNRNSSINQTALRNFAEDIGLGEFLGTNDNWRCTQRTRKEN